MNACAYLVEPAGGADTALRAIASRLGFATVLPYGGIALAEQQLLQTPLCFFLFAAVPAVKSLASAAQAIRFCTSRRLRFSPLIYFAKDASLETIKACINMGFDDIIIEPFSKRRVEERLSRQIGTSLTYYETASYFGPDRRNRLGEQTDHGDHHRNGGQYRRLEIIRNLITGINVVRDDLQVML